MEVCGSKNAESHENIVYHFFRQLWLVWGVKLMEINSNGCFPGGPVILEFPYHDRIPSVFQGWKVILGKMVGPKGPTGDWRAP